MVSADDIRWGLEPILADIRRNNIGAGADVSHWLARTNLSVEMAKQISGGLSGVYEKSVIAAIISSIHIPALLGTLKPHDFESLDALLAHIEAASKH